MFKKLRESGAKLREIAPNRRSHALREEDLIDWEDLAELSGGSLKDWAGDLDGLAENVFAAFPMPWGIAEHFRVNGRDIPGIPMVTEERTVIAAASKAAKYCGPEGFLVEAGPSLARAQVLLHTDFRSGAWGRYEDAIERVHRLIIAEVSDTCPVFRNHGGGLKALDTDSFYLDLNNGLTPCTEFTLTVDTGEAMGAHGVTRLARVVGEALERRFGWEPLSWICLNDNPARHVHGTARWHREDIGEKTIRRVLLNQQWAEQSPDRAKTHNKGVMNGVIAVAQTTGQDTRAIEAGFWADAYREGGVCWPVTCYERTAEGDLLGRLNAQITVGTVGGATSHPCAAISRKMMGTGSSADLAAVMGAVGLAQNFAALAWALNT